MALTPGYKDEPGMKPMGDVYSPKNSKPAPAADDPLEVIYQQLKQRYPQIPDPDLREGAARMLKQIQQKQAEEFYSTLFPERAEQPASPQAPTAPAYPPPAVQKQMVAQEQEQFARQQARPRITPPGGQAQPIMPPSQGTPYNPQAPAGKQVTDQELAALNAGAGPNSMKRYFRNPDGTLGIAQ